MLNRREYFKSIVLLGTFFGLPQAQGLSAQTEKPLLAGWQKDPRFFFRKSIRSSGRGVPNRIFPWKIVAEAIWDSKPGSYRRIRSLFEQYLSNPLDPAGSLVDLPEAVKDLVRLMPDPPLEGSALLGRELAEVYWAARLRDVSFSDYAHHDLVDMAYKDLSDFNLYTDEYQSSRPFDAPWSDGKGFYVSAFLLADIPAWPEQKKQLYPSLPKGQDFGTTGPEWEQIQSGDIFALKPTELRGPSGYLTNGRRLATLVYQDHPSQVYQQVALQLYQMKFRVFERRGIWGHQERYKPFVFGGLPDLLHRISDCCKLALDASWLAKWGRFFYPRPEEVSFWTINSEVEDSLWSTKEALMKLELFRDHERLPLLSQAYPEGAPVHPSYPAAHAVVAGAAVTVIKAFLRSSPSYLPNSIANWDDIGYPSNGLDELEVTKELDKLAWNMSFGRCFAGVHFRSDCTSGIFLGEKIAIFYLEQIKKTFPDQVQLKVKRFDGSEILV